MCVISVYPDGDAIVQFDNIRCSTNVLGQTAQLQAEISSKYIEKMEAVGQLASENAMRLTAILADVPA